MIPQIFGQWAGRRPARQSRSFAYRPQIDYLEERVTPTVYKVMATVGTGSVNTFTTLSQAVTTAQPGDTIIIEPGANPGAATVTQNNLTITGDPSAGYQGLQLNGTLVTGITLLGSGDILTNLNIGFVNIGIGCTSETISKSLFSGTGVTQAYGTGFSSPNDGDNMISGCTFVDGANVTLGDIGGSAFDTAANDTVSSNVFWDPVNYAISEENEIAGMVITNNRIIHTDPNTGLAFIQVIDCVGTISGNTLSLDAAPGSVGILANDLSLDDMSTNLTIVNNVVSSNQTGIEVEHLSSTDTFNVSVTNNTLAGNFVGLQLTGNGTGAGNDFGALTIGGNDFRGFKGTNGNYAILSVEGNNSTSTFVTPVTTTITAQNNIFSVASAQTASLVSAASDAVINTSNELTGGVATVTAMFQTLGGGPPTSTQMTAASKLNAMGQATAAVNSYQAARVFVDSLYISLLGRMPASGEDEGWVNALASGAMTEGQAISGFITSAEYFSKVTYGSTNPNALAPGFNPCITTCWAAWRAARRLTAGWARYLHSSLQAW